MELSTLRLTTLNCSAMLMYNTIIIVAPPEFLEDCGITHHTQRMREALQFLSAFECFISIIACFFMYYFFISNLIIKKMHFKKIFHENVNLQ